MQCEEHFDELVRSDEQVVTCPSCGAPVERLPGEVDFHCTNSPSHCPEQLKEWIRWYAHRDAMDVDGLGLKLIEQLVDRGLVKGLADLYRLDEATLSDLERMGKKSANNLVNALEVSKRRTLDRFITGLTIRHVGTRSAEILAEQVPGRSVELRVAPFVAVQAVPGPRHTRGTPPNVVETDGPTWLRVATGRRSFAEAVADGSVRASGNRADLTEFLPLLS